MKASAILSLGLFLVICVGLTQIGCKGAQGPAGPPGEGFTGLEGFATGIKCATCHSSDQDTTYYVAGRRYQWSSSLHAVGGHSERNDVNCAGCHTTEGVMERYRRGWSTQVTAAVLNPSPPGCFACHSPHARNDFSIRDTNAVTITSFITGVADAQYNYGRSNMCVRCHQTRTSSPMSPKPDPTKTAMTDTITITSSRWYPHYGVNAQMLMRTGGFEFVDTVYTPLTDVTNLPHTNHDILKREGCIKCHMAEPLGTQAGIGGGHTFKVTYEVEGTTGVVLTGCRDAACHGSTFPRIDYISRSSALTGSQGVQTYIKRYLDTLHTMLTDTNVVKKWTIGSAKPWLTTSDLVNVPLKIMPASRAGALYNYFFLEHEGSFGVHNSRYAIELLKSSIRELRKP